MCAVPILICSHWAARGTNMVRCLAAPLSPREISQLLDLRHGKSQSDPSGFKRFIMLGLVEERPGGFAITELAGNVWTPNLGLSPQTAVARRFSGGKDVGASTGAALSPLCFSH